MSRIAVHVVAGLLFVGVGAPDAQESMPRPPVVEERENDSSSPRVPFQLDCAAGIEGDVGVTVAIAPSIHVDDPNDNLEGRQNSAKSPQDASDPPQAKAGTARRWFAGAMLWMVEFVVRGLLDTGGR